MINNVLTLDIINQMNEDAGYSKGQTLLEALNIYLDGNGLDKQTSLERAVTAFLEASGGSTDSDEPEEPDPSSVI